MTGKKSGQCVWDGPLLAGCSTTSPRYYQPLVPQSSCVEKCRRENMSGRPRTTAVWIWTRPPLFYSIKKHAPETSIKLKKSTFPHSSEGLLRFRLLKVLLVLCCCCWNYPYNLNVKLPQKCSGKNPSAALYNQTLGFALTDWTDFKLLELRLFFLHPTVRFQFRLFSFSFQVSIHVPSGPFRGTRALIVDINYYFFF